MASLEQSPFSEASSPGPLRISDLQSSGIDGISRVTPPRRLKPISSEESRPKRRKKRSKQLSSMSASTSSTPPPLLNQDVLSKLKARLEQEENTTPTPSPPPPPAASAAIHGSPQRDSPSVSPPPAMPPVNREVQADLERDECVQADLDETMPSGAETHEKKHRKKKRKRKKENADETQELTEVENTEDPLPSELLERTADIESGRQTRQLPEFPMGAEESCEFPRASVAMQPHIATSLLHPGHEEGGVLQLLAGEEVKEETGSRDRLAETHYTLPSQSNPFITNNPKEVVFVERRDGKGFFVRKVGASAAQESVSRPVALDYDITSSFMALQVHRFLQQLALIAHGLIAGLSVWDCVVLNLLSYQSGEHLNVLEHYHPLTLPTHALHFLCLTLVLVSIMDRFDFARCSRKCLQSFIQSPLQIILLAAWACVVVALVVTLSAAAIDHRIAIFQTVPELWPNIFEVANITVTPTLPPTRLQISTKNEPELVYYIPSVAEGDTPSTHISGPISSLLALAIVRALCCFLSWVAVLWVTKYDRLEDYLRKIDHPHQTTETTNSNGKV